MAFLPLLLAGLALATPRNDLEKHFAGRTGCFVLLDLDRGTYVRHDAARCAQRFSPCSTFKIPNTLIALETGVAPDATFQLPWDGKPRERPEWNRDHDLRSAFANSVVWYYQEIARRVGAERMQEHLARFHYGNEDTSGGITTFWIGSTLAISADEQVEFLARLARGTLPVAPRSRAILDDLMIVEQKPAYTLRGKTGSNRVADHDLGWFVGSVTRGERHWVFATNIEGRDSLGKQAREITLEILRSMQLVDPVKQE